MTTNTEAGGLHPSPSMMNLASILGNPVDNPESHVVEDSESFMRHGSLSRGRLSPIAGKGAPAVRATFMPPAVPDRKEVAIRVQCRALQPIVNPPGGSVAKVEDISTKTFIPKS